LLTYRNGPGICDDILRIRGPILNKECEVGEAKWEVEHEAKQMRVQEKLLKDRQELRKIQ